MGASLTEGISHLPGRPGGLQLGCAASWHGLQVGYIAHVCFGNAKLMHPLPQSLHSCYLHSAAHSAMLLCGQTELC